MPSLPTKSLKPPTLPNFTFTVPVPATASTSLPSNIDSAGKEKSETFPHEILALIAGKLPPSEFYRAVSLSRRIYSFLAPHHYRNLYGSLFINMEACKAPPAPKPKAKGKLKSQAEKAKKLKYKAKVKARQKEGASDVGLGQGAEDGEGVVVSGTSVIRPEPRPEVPLTIPLYVLPHLGGHNTGLHPFLGVSRSVRGLFPNLFAFTTDLSLPYHIDFWCQNYQALDMPVLHTLRIIPPHIDVNPGLLDLCVDFEHHAAHAESYYGDSFPTCSLVSKLRPKRVVLGGVETSFAGFGAGLWTADAPFPPLWLEELVVYIGEIADLGGHYFLACLPDTLKRVSMVIQPPGDRQWFRQPSDGEPWDFWIWLAGCCISEVGTIEVVGLEDIDEYWSARGVEGMQEDLKSSIVGALEHKDMSQAEIDEKIGAVKFISRKDWDAREKAEKKGP